MLDKTVGGIATVLEGLEGSTELLELAEAEQDEDTALAVVADVERFGKDVEKLEFQRMFSGQMDTATTFVDIQVGAAERAGRRLLGRQAAQVGVLGFDGVGALDQPLLSGAEVERDRRSFLG